MTKRDVLKEKKSKTVVNLLVKKRTNNGIILNHGGQNRNFDFQMAYFCMQNPFEALLMSWERYMGVE